MLMKEADYIALGKWIKDNSYLQIPANAVGDYFKQLKELQAENEELRAVLKKQYARVDKLEKLLWWLWDGIKQALKGEKK